MKENSKEYLRAEGRNSNKDIPETHSSAPHKARIQILLKRIWLQPTVAGGQSLDYFGPKLVYISTFDGPRLDGRKI